MRIGRWDVEIFSDGTFKLDGGSLYGIVPRVLWSKRVPPDEQNRLTLEMNCLLVRDRSDGHVVIVETGAGAKLDERQRGIFGVERPPALLDELAARGVQPGDVTLVLNTHLHWDHAGGNTRVVDGAVVPTFPRASYVAQRDEWEDAHHTNERTRGSYFADDYSPLERTGRLELVDGDAEILPGLWIRRHGGHTRGTQSIVVSDGRETLFLSSDFMMDRHHVPPAWNSAYDLYPLDVLALKKTVLEQAAREDWVFAFTHDRPRFGRIRESEGRFSYEERS